MKLRTYVCLLTFITVSVPTVHAELPLFESPIQITQSDFDNELSRNTRGSMLFDSDGTLHLVYTERVEGTSDIGASGVIYYRRLSNNKWSEPLAVRTDTGRPGPFGHGGNPSLYVSQSGSVNFVWHDYRNSTSPSGLDNIDVYFRRLLPTGLFESPEIRITSHTENQYRPKIHGTPDGRIGVGWYDFLRAEGPDFLLTLSDREGHFDTAESFDFRLVEDANIDKEPIPGSHFFLGVVIPQFVFDSEGRLHAVWTTGFVDAQGTMNYGMMPAPPDRSMDPVIRVSEHGGSFSDPPRVRVDQEDTAWFVWTERVTQKFHNVWLSCKDPSDSTYGPLIQITDYDQANTVECPDLAIAPNGEIYIVWADKRDGEWDLYLKAYDPNLDRLSEETRLTEDLECSDTRPCIDISGNGRIGIVWQRTLNGNTDLFFIHSQTNTVVDDWRLFE